MTMILLLLALLMPATAVVQAEEPGHDDDISDVFVWIDGNPIFPDSGDTPYVVEVAADEGDSVITINGYVAVRMPARLWEPREVTGSPTRRAVHAAMDSVRRAGGTSLDEAEAGAAILRADTAWVREAVPTRSSVMVTYVDGTTADWYTTRPRREREPLARSAETTTRWLSDGTTILISHHGRGLARKSVPPPRRQLLLEEIIRARREFRESDWSSEALDALWAADIHSPGPLQHIGGN